MVREGQTRNPPFVIEVLVDAQIEIRYSNIKGKKVIPAGYEPDMIFFIKPGESVCGVGSGFGNTLITRFFADVRESRRLNLHRIETDPTN